MLNKILLSLSFNMDLQSILFAFGMETGIKECSAIPVSAFLLPVLVSAAINLAAETFALFVGPMFSFLLCCVFWIVSAYWAQPYIFGNYAMILRHVWFWNKGVSVNTGLFISVMIITVSLITGLIRFQHYDILNKNQVNI